MGSQLPTPVFIFSLPRSGSTLLQRILAAHPDVATASEPWILLPILMARRTSGTYAVYRHEDAVHAIDQFVQTLPEGTVSFDRALRDFVRELYRSSAGYEVRYFVDKTPRYHLVAHEIMHLFPHAKFVFLWRSPLSVANSMIRTWGGGHWNLFRYWVDLEYGPGNLVEAYRAHAESAMAIQYEELIYDPESAAKQLFEYLELDYRSEVLDGFAGVELTGLMGDRTGLRYGATISTASSRAWSEMLSSPVRKAWVRGYLRRLGDDIIEAMGYEHASLLESLAEVPGRFGSAPNDLARMAYGVAYKSFDLVVEWRTQHYLNNAGRRPIIPPSCIRESSE